MEFPVVFLVNLVSERFPTRERKEQIPIPEKLIKEILPQGDYHEQEERRLFYVGLTRARDRLFLTAADYYGEGKREKKLSPFVFETLGEIVMKSLNHLDIKSGQPPLLVWQKEEEKNSAVIRQPINYLSFSQIEAFNNCPLQYRYRFLQKIPTPPSGALTFGDSIHKTLKEFGEGVKNKQKLNQKDLLKILENNWSSIGYTSKSHEEKARKQAEKLLINFYKDFDHKVRIMALEQPFTLKIGPNLKVVGKIDRIDEKKDKFLEIIDYKTGKTMEQKDVDKSLQMTVYALAVSDKGIYNKKPEDLILTFYFLDSGKKISTKRTAEQLVQVKKDILEKAKEIMTSSFEPKPNGLCDFCEYRLLCEAWS